MKRLFKLSAIWVTLLLSSTLISVNGADSSGEDQFYATNEDKISLSINDTHFITQKTETQSTGYEEVTYLNMTTDRHRKLRDITQAAAKAQYAANMGDKGLRTYGSWSLKNHVKGNLVKILGGQTCRKSGDFNCKAEYSPLQTNCNLVISNFCADSTKACAVFVVDIALSILDILSNFFPPAKAIKALKGVYKLSKQGANAMVKKAKEAIVDKVRKEARDEMMESVAKKFSREAIATKFVQNNVDSSITWLIDNAVEEATDELALATVTKNLKYEHGKKKLGKDDQTRQEEERAVLELFAEMDPTGVFTIANQLFLGPNCNERKLVKMDCQFGGTMYQEQDALDKCCAGVQNPGRRVLAGARPRTSPGGKARDRQNREVNFRPGISSCNKASGDVGCPETQGPAVAVLPTKFTDSQLRFLQKIDGNHMGIFFQVPRSAQDLWQELFGTWHLSTHCDVSYMNMFKNYCVNDDNEFVQDQDWKKNYCIEVALKYFDRCEINPYGPEDTPHEVRQCRSGNTIWEGKLTMYGNWMGRKFGYQANYDDWESGDIIVPVTYCCPKSGYDLPTATARGCHGTYANNKYWAYKMLNCDWVNKNPHHRCDTKSSHGIVASHSSKGCRSGCQAGCRSKPNIEPNVGSRVKGNWGNPPHSQFLIEYNSWAWKVWKEMAIDELDDDGDEVYEVQHCRDGISLFNGFIVANDESEGLVGSYAANENRPNSWLDGDVVIAVGGDFNCRDTLHTGSKATFTPTNAPVTLAPTKNPTEKPSEHPTSAPTVAPGIPPYGVRIIASKDSLYGRPQPNPRGIRTGPYFCVDEFYRNDKFREMCLDSAQDQKDKGNRYQPIEIKLCRRGVEIWQGKIKWPLENWCAVDYEYRFPTTYQDGDVIITSTEDCKRTSSKTIGSLGHGQKCSKTAPQAPTRAPISATACPWRNSSNTHYDQLGIVVAYALKGWGTFCVPVNQREKMKRDKVYWTNQRWTLCDHNTKEYKAQTSTVTFDWNTWQGKFDRRLGVSNGDVLLPFENGRKCSEISTQPTRPPVRAPVRVPTRPTNTAIRKPTEKPIEKTTAPVTSAPTTAPGIPPYGVRINASESSRYRQPATIRGVRSGAYFCVDQSYINDKFREMCLDSREDQRKKGKSQHPIEIKQCRNGVEIWRGSIQWYSYYWCGAEQNNRRTTTYQDGDVIITSTEDCRRTSSKTIGSLGHGQKCSKTAPQGPTRAPISATACFWKNPSNKNYDHKSAIVIGFANKGYGVFCVPVNQREKMSKWEDRWWKFRWWKLCDPNTKEDKDRAGGSIDSGKLTFDWNTWEGKFMEPRVVVGSGDVLIINERYTDCSEIF